MLRYRRRISAILGMMAAACLALTPPTPAQATGIIFVDASATGAGDGTGWTDAYTTLQDALNKIPAPTAGTEIWVAEGIYYPDEGMGQTGGARSSTFELIDGVAIYGGFAGSEGSTSRPTLTNVTFTGNTTPGSGGALSNRFGQPTIHNSLFWNNLAGSTGSAMANSNGSAVIATHSLIDAAGVDNTLGASWTENGAGNITNGSDPLFVDAPGGDLGLQPTSPAVDAGNNADVPGGVTTDRGGDPRIVDGDGDGTATVDMGAFETPSTAPDADPTGLTASYDAAAQQVVLSWTDASSNEAGFIIERQKEGASGWVPLTTTAADTESYTDATATCDQRYVYRVIAANAAGASAPAISDVVDTACDIFDDLGALPAPFMEPWVEDFFQAGITTGKGDCTASADPVPGQTFYCGSDPVTRADMAVFILRAFDTIPDPTDP